SPVEDFTPNLSLQFLHYTLPQPKYHLQQSKNPHPTYPPPLPLKLPLIIKQTAQLKQQQLFIPHFPLITHTPTFLINPPQPLILS
ncbi:hypothetical protein, partial [Staphylococcus epidermidis]|uniref:hypothetical protein n=1 Tax=Staphylococcus epidermidis TaxID=1282 RepID=UPI001C93527C